MLLPHGTAGDVLPYIWLGRRLLEHGHAVTMVWVESFREAAEHAGLTYIALRDDGFADLMASPSIWKPGAGMRLGYEFAGRCTAKYVAAVEEDIALRGPPDLLVAPLVTFAARLLREKLGVPFVSSSIHPFPFVSAYEVPGGLPAVRLLRMLPLPLRRLILFRAAPYDRFALPGVRQCCIEHGVKPPRSLRREWYHSPDGVLALFPYWYAAPQPDWPANTFQWDFPLEDMADATPLTPELQNFLEAGDKPVVFTLGTGNVHVRAFFEAAAKVTARLGCRAVFVTREPQQTGTSPPETFVTAYAPFSRLLPHASAFVHHGGTGTTAMCLAAGLPQLITPLTFDQPDNAERVVRLGAGLSMNVDRFTEENAAPVLQRCLQDASIRRCAQTCAERLRSRRPVADLVAWLESRMHHKRPSDS
ncbi:glycosyltransferase [Prosthecobacter sp.]|uniref:glycosyltransferase n=1 Tax=Prosthecobacter sp. TaxID=1965333 RepID=UPI001DDFF7B8|nr:glycosyltransferase [Prosthecobacter sp.]MCB1277638.1 glycosyltransferase family 1 protein [Prosthecobacter sp.]